MMYTTGGGDGAPVVKDNIISYVMLNSSSSGSFRTPFPSEIERCLQDCKAKSIVISRGCTENKTDFIEYLVLTRVKFEQEFTK